MPPSTPAGGAQLPALDLAIVDVLQRGLAIVETANVPKDLQPAAYGRTLDILAARLVDRRPENDPALAA